MQIRRSAVIYLSQDSMILSSQVNCTGTHLRGRTLLIRKVGRSDPTNDAEKAPRISSKLIMDFVDSAKYLCGTTTSKERLSSHREPRSVEQRVPRPRRS